MKSVDLPAGWVSETLPELIARGGVFVDGDWVESKDQDGNGDVRLVQLADVGDGAYRNRSSRFLTSAKAVELGCTYLQAGDVLIARMPDPLGRACIFPGDSKRCVTVVDVCIFRSGTSGINHRWLMWFVNSPQFRARVESLQSGTTRKRISRGNLATISLPVPPLAEQARIVEAIETQFSRLDAAAAALERARAKLKRYRAAVLNAACSGRLVPTEADSIDTLPKGWQEIQIQSLLREPLRNGHSAKATGNGTGVRTLTLTAVTVGEFSERTTKLTSADPTKIEDLWLRPGDILIERSNTPDLVGTTRMYRGPEHFAIFPDLVIRARLNSSVLPAFAEIVFSSDTGRRYFKSRAQGISGSMPKIDQGTIERFPMPVPPVAVQEGIVAEVERRLSGIERMEAAIAAELKRAERLRQSILHKAFSGQLVPQDPDDEPASVLLERIKTERALSPVRVKRPKRS